MCNDKATKDNAPCMTKGAKTMKRFATISELKKHNEAVYAFGYCDLYYICFDLEPTLYNSGVYGWNWDAYTLPESRVAFITGYRNLRGIRIPYETVKAYTAKAESIIDEWRKGRTCWAEMCEALTDNRAEMVNSL